MKREMEQQKEFLPHRFEALKDAAESIGIQQNKISYIEERSWAASVARWRLFVNQDERSMEEISDICTKRVTLANGANMPVTPPLSAMYRRCIEKS